MKLASGTLAMLTASGCLGAAHVRGGARGVVGAGVSAEGPVSKLRFGVESGYERTEGSTSSGARGAIAADVTARIGLVSALRDSRCPTCVGMPWVELGPAAGLGLALTGPTEAVGHAFAGTWLDVRLSSATSHPVLRIEVQRDAYSGADVGEIQLVVGLGYVNWDVRW